MRWRVHAFVATAIVVGGGFSALAGLVLLAGSIRFFRAASRTTALVVGHEPRVTRDQDGLTTHIHPVVEFEDEGGQKRLVTLAMGTAGFQPFPLGSRVELLFLPGDQATARIRHFLHLWFFPAMFIGLGGMGMGFGLLFRAWTSGLR